MLKCFINYSLFKILENNFISNSEEIRKYYYFNLLKSENIIFHLIGSSKKIETDNSKLINYLKRTLRLKIEEDNIDISNLDIYNNNRTIAFNENITQNINDKGIIIIPFSNGNPNIFINAIKKLFHSEIFEKTDREKVQFNCNIPISTLIYQDNYFFKSNTFKDAYKYKKEILQRFNFVFDNIINNNKCFFYNNNIRLYIVFQMYDPKFDSDIKLEFKKLIKDTYNIDLYIEFIKGNKRPHSRFMISEYFYMYAGESFDDNTIIHFNSIFSSEGKNGYQLYYKRIKNEFGNLNFPLIDL